MKYIDELLVVLKHLNGTGVFLTAGKKPNTMTASWGFAGVMWGKPILIVPVRPSRFTHDLIEEGGVFSVSAPLDAGSDKLLAYFGSVSGRNVDKYTQKGIVPVKCRSIDTFVMPGSFCHFECKVTYKDSIEKQKLDEKIIGSLYRDNSFHTLFYGEIIEAYRT